MRRRCSMRETIERYAGYLPAGCWRGWWPMSSEDGGCGCRCCRSERARQLLAEWNATERGVSAGEVRA